MTVDEMIIASINCLDEIEEHFKTQMVAWVRCAADFGEINDQLVKENAELKADNDARKFAMAMSEKVEKQLREENAELQEKLEGAEKARDYWKDSSFDWRHKCTSRKPFKVAVKAQKQLAKAKEIIIEFIDNVERYSINNEILDRADAFLNREVEK